MERLIPEAPFGCRAQAGYIERVGQSLIGSARVNIGHAFTNLNRIGTRITAFGAIPLFLLGRFRG